ncbi:MAG: hypothetical protein PHH09_03100 [Methanoregulaceae archaeon]|jgi:hypothetical protein|nr:hypothetical protein [Methanoregulaceae archaeon]
MTNETPKKEQEKKPSPEPWGIKDATLRETFNQKREKPTRPAAWGKKDTKLREPRELGED